MLLCWYSKHSSFSQSTLRRKPLSVFCSFCVFSSKYTILVFLYFSSKNMNLGDSLCFYKLFEACTQWIFFRGTHNGINNNLLSSNNFEWAIIVWISILCIKAMRYTNYKLCLTVICTIFFHMEQGVPVKYMFKIPSLVQSHRLVNL